MISFWICTSMANKETSEISPSPDKPYYTPEVLSPGNESQYVMNLEMNSQGSFKVDSTTNIKNTSADRWSQVLFYFIPNMFTEENSPSLDNPAVVDIETVKVNGANASFTLEKDTLSVQLESELLPESEVEIVVQYSFSLPKNGHRFTINSGNYYLAQWYPMAATYRNGKWNKEDYLYYGETYHNGFSDFTINYEIPEEYTIVSTGDQDMHPGKSSGSLKAINVKEFFISISKDPTITQGEIDDVNVRVIGVGKFEKYKEEILQISLDALQYFQQTVGEYPHKQLDIILDEISMEYPGVVTVGKIGSTGSYLNIDYLKQTVVHEIAHQWFYGVISNDPFYDGWLDEGFATLATGLFFSELENKEYSPAEDILEKFPLPVNMPLSSYSAMEKGTYHYHKPTVNLWNTFKEHGGKQKLEEFLKVYYKTYQYRELNTQEFIKFLTHYLDIDDDAYFEEWITLKE